VSLVTFMQRKSFIFKSELLDFFNTKHFNVTQVLKVIVHTKPKVTAELDGLAVLNGMLKSVYV